MRIALVHEYLSQYGGAERLLQVLSSMFPNAPIYTLFYDKEGTGYVFENKIIKTSFLQRLPFVNSQYKFFPLLMPLAIEQFDFSEFEIVISVSSSFAKGIITKPDTRHICYCLTPPRFLWDSSQKFVKDFNYNFLLKKVLPIPISYLRMWDIEASIRPDEIIAISNFVKERILKYYKRDSLVIYPPVNIDNFSISDRPGRYFLAVGRLVSYKKFDLIINAFNKLKLPLIIVGSGPEYNNLNKIAKSNIKFLGRISDSQLNDIYSEAIALIFPQEEDFGITALEAMASGKPVIAYRSGGATETVLEEVTGEFFDKQTVDNLIEAVLNFKSLKFNPVNCRQQAERFSINNFREIFKKSIEVY